MSIGSAFDAYVKSDIYSNLFGSRIIGSPYEFETIFEKQVEKQHRNWARIHGRYVFDRYKASGALADLMLELNGAIGEPKFEFDLQAEVRGMDKTISGVVFLGKPDLHFTNKQNLSVILDWKVNGYVSKWPTSPKPGYVCKKPGWSMHKDCDRVLHKGMYINRATTMDKVDAGWAAQLSIYSWLCGDEIGSDFVTAIDQIVCNTKGLTLQWPELVFAQHRTLVDPQFQIDLFNLAKSLWDSIADDHYFRELTKDESIERGKLLEERAKSLWEPVTSVEDKMFQTMTRVPRTH